MDALTIRYLTNRVPENLAITCARPDTRAREGSVRFSSKSFTSLSLPPALATRTRMSKICKTHTSKWGSELRVGSQDQRRQIKRLWRTYLGRLDLLVLVGYEHCCGSQPGTACIWSGRSSPTSAQICVLLPQANPRGSWGRSQAVSLWSSIGNIYQWQF
jgi:hypothetical protein